MSKSAPIAITSEELRDRGEERLGLWIPDAIWEHSEAYARRKLGLCRDRQPDVDYYDNDYLVLLTVDTVKELAFSEYTATARTAIAAARAQ